MDKEGKQAGSKSGGGVGGTVGNNTLLSGLVGVVVVVIVVVVVVVVVEIGLKHPKQHGYLVSEQGVPQLSQLPDVVLTLQHFVPILSLRHIPLPSC